MGGGADELGAVSMCAVGGGGEVASSSSSITLAFTLPRRKNIQSLQEMECDVGQQSVEEWSQTGIFH